MPRRHEDTKKKMDKKTSCLRVLVAKIQGEEKCYE
jgi:hypothetical protein